MKTIFAVGGGSFFHQADSKLSGFLFERASARSSGRKPKMLYLGTAFGDDQSVVDRFLQSPLAQKFEVTHLSLFLPFTGWRESFENTDLIFVPGGNTRSMLAIWREWQIPELIKRALNQGVIVAGVSAGAICWFEQCYTDSDPDKLATINGLGFIKGIACAHFDSRSGEFRKASMGIDPQYGFCDDKGYLFEDGELRHIVEEAAQT